MEFYEATFLTPAHPCRFWKETCCLPRLRDFRQMNTNRQIQDGHRVFTRRRDTKYEYDVECSLVNLRWKRNPRTGEMTGNYGRLVYSLKLKDGARYKSWFLTSYEDDQPITFIMLDLDRHFAAEMTPDKKEIIETKFWTNVHKLMAFGKDNDLDILWTTSPGDIVDNEHVQGLYAWIKLDQPVLVQNLRESVFGLIDYLGLEKVEHNTEYPNRPLRLLGQRHVELVTVDPSARSMVVIEPVGLKSKKYNVNVERFALVVQAWFDLKPISPEELFKVTPSQKEKKNEGQNVSISCISPPKYIMSTPSGMSSVSTGGNTYTTICQAAGWCVRRYDGDHNMQTRIIEEVEVLVRQHHGQGRTCSEADLLRRKVKQVVGRQLALYRPTQGAPANGKWAERRKRHRELQARLDAADMLPVADIRTSELASVLQDMGISPLTIGFMVRWLVVARGQNGRVAVKKRGIGAAGTTMIELAGNERRYRRVIKEIGERGLWRMIEDHVHCLHRCRQVTLSDAVIQAIRAQRAKNAKRGQRPSA